MMKPRDYRPAVITVAGYALTVILGLLAGPASAQSLTCVGGTIALSANWTLAKGQSLALPPGCVVHGNGFTIDLSSAAGASVTGTAASPVLMDHLGSATTNSFTFGTPSWGINWTHFVCDTCGRLASYTVASFSMSYGSFPNLIDAGGYNIFLNGGGSGEPIFDHMYLTGAWLVGMTQYHCMNIYQDGGADAFYDDCDATSGYNFIRFSSGAVGGAIITAAADFTGLKNTYILFDVAAPVNPHVLGTPGTSALSAPQVIYDHMLFESIDDPSGDVGKVIAGQAGGASNSVGGNPVVLQNSITLPTRTGRGWTLLRGGGVYGGSPPGTDNGYRIAFSHNVWFGVHLAGPGSGIGDGQGAINTDENNTVPEPTHAITLKDNILWSPTNADIWYKLHYVATGPISTDACDPVSGCAHNDGWNYTAANATCASNGANTCTNEANGYEGKFTSTPGRTDLNVDPQFVDYRRSFALWDTKYLGQAAGPAWASGQKYTAGTVVSITDPNSYWGLPVNFTCLVSHTSSAINEPMLGSGNWRVSWEFTSARDLRNAVQAGTTYTDATIGCTACSVVAALEDWIFAGYRPTNPRLSGAASDGTDIGAVPMRVGGLPPVCDAGAQRTFRAGFPATLDGTGSVSRNGNPTLVYVWQQLTSQPITWKGQTSAMPVITGMTAGALNFQLTVTDSSGQASMCTIHNGVVATDANGYVIVNSPAVSTILGPMTQLNTTGTGNSFNPWPWADQAQKAWLDQYGSWQGTIPSLGGTFVASWQTPNPPSTPGKISTTCGSNIITGSGTTFGQTFCGSSATFPCTPPQNYYLVSWYIPEATIVSASQTNPMVLTLGSTNPSRLFPSLPVGPGGVITIAGVSGAGCAAMNGRQTVSAIGASFTALPPSFPAGATTITINFDGTGCNYTGSSATASTPDSTGRRLYNIASVQSDTSLKLNAETGPWSLTDGTQTGLYYSIWTDTEISQWGGNGSSFNNFYDNVLAFYEMYYRTGIDTYLGYARWLADAWWTMPEMDRGVTNDYNGNGGGGLFPRSMGLAGMYLRALDQDQASGMPGASPMWAGLRQHLNAYNLYFLGLIGPKSAVGDREQYYQINELAMCALADPDTSPGGQRQTCLSVLDKFLSSYLASQRRSDGSWQWLAGTGNMPSVDAQSLNNPAAAPFVDVKNGSTSVSCSAGSTCNFQASWFTWPIVAVSQTNPAVLTFQNFLVAKGGTPQGLTTSRTITLSGAGGPGCSGLNGTWTVSATHSDSTAFYATIPFDARGCTYTPLSASLPWSINFWTTGSVMDAGATADTTLYQATYVDSQHLTISPAYQGATATVRQWALAHSWIGFGQQPYMLGILSDALTVSYYALTQSIPGYPSGYDARFASTIAGWMSGMANWLTTTAYDSASRGSWYAVGFGVCNSPTNDWTCNEGQTANNGGLRELTLEAMGGLAQTYALNPSPSLLTRIDDAYSANFAKYASDPGYDGLYDSDMDPFSVPAGWWWSRNAAKWPGFLWGFGRSYNWPAARLGGVRPTQNVTVRVGGNMSGIPRATKMQVTVTEPSGVVDAPMVCNVSPCSVTVNKTAGNYLLQVSYLSAGGMQLAVGRPMVVTIN